MKVTDLNPRFFSHGGEGIYDKDMQPIPLREKMGMLCECPCGKHLDKGLLMLSFRNPPDGGPPLESESGRPLWERVGEDFETITLRPSILNMSCGWHGYFTNGEVVTV